MDSIDPSAEASEAAWRAAHRQFALQLAAALRVGEGRAGVQGSRVDERLVQAIWADQMLKPGLSTASGKAIEVVEPGRWNTGRGPDFLDARLRIAGQTVQGDVEIHVDSADWRRHGHDRDFEYNRVVLHATLRAGDDRPHDEKQNGERLERLVLEHALEPDLETIRATINPGDYPYGRPDDLGLCHDEFLRLPEGQAAEFFKAAGRARIEQKVARFAAQRATADFAQVLYQALMTGQGFKSSKTLYFLLSKRCPIGELADHAQDVAEGERADFYLSALLHVARLMPEQLEFADGDEEHRAFRARLDAHWRRVRPYFSDRLIPPTKRWYAGMRPAGFPTRRLAAMALLLGRMARRETSPYAQAKTLVMAAPGEADAKGWKKFFGELARPFEVEAPDHYFATHFTFGGKKQPASMLLGGPAAESVLFNIALPLMVLEGRERKDRALESAAWRVLYRFPPLERNSVVKFMAHRLFGDSGAEKGLLRAELFQQAMLKVFSDCCAENERTCEDCTFLALAEKLR